MESRIHPAINESATRAVYARSHFIFTAATIVLLAALVLPIGGVFLDILWVFALCLTTAVVLVCFSATDSLELVRFPAMLGITILLRLFLAVVSVKLIFFQETGGHLITWVGDPVAVVGATWGLILIPIVGGVLVFGIYHACERISKSSMHYSLEVMPVKQISLEEEIQAGRVDSQKADFIRDRIFEETRFFLNMEGVSRLMRFDAVLSLLIVLISIIGHLILANLDRAGTLLFYASLSGGLAAMTLLPGTAIALSVAHLVSKSSLTLEKVDYDAQLRRAKKVNIVSKDGIETEEVELLNPEFADVGSRSEPPVESRTEAAAEVTAEFEPVESAAAEGPAVQTIELEREGFANADEFYQRLADVAREIPAERKPVLFTGDHYEQLPVTSVVNVAVRLADGGAKVLLIDADRQRCALARVFDLDPARAFADGPQPTYIENLFVWLVPGAEEAEEQEDSIREMATLYDESLIYAPTTEALEQTAGPLVVGASAVVFWKEYGARDRMVMMLEGASFQTAAMVRMGDRD